ncbi:uncharacterized protein G2W53_039408 [Senna tora]|uniref:Uncharacterized protein n=1 Tax=Senna tora TaxID=362788 RepID=A0A834W2T5_9FABA|nr:uncharacterized protein G2W53_039408 [Senna tora]
MPEGCLHELGNIWLTEEYQKKQLQNKQNRASAKGGSLHTCGSITISEHKRRMMDYGQDVVQFVILFLSATQSSSWFHPEIEQEIERRVAKANEESNAAIKKLEENYKKDIDELTKKLIISSRNQHEQDDDASE